MNTRRLQSPGWTEASAATCQQNIKSHFCLLVARQWHMTLIPTLRRQRQADLCEFEARLVYRVSFRAVRAIQRKPVLKN